MIINNKASGHYLFIEANEPFVEGFEFCRKARLTGQTIVAVGFCVFSFEGNYGNILIPHGHSFSLCVSDCSCMCTLACVCTHMWA